MKFTGGEVMLAGGRVKLTGEEVKFAGGRVKVVMFAD